MRKTKELLAYALRQEETSQQFEKVCRQAGISEATYPLRRNLVVWISEWYTKKHEVAGKGLLSKGIWVT